MNIEFQVWWIPQVPMESFNVEVPDLETGIFLIDTLARYDLFQYENKVKPDYANAGGLQYRVVGDREWTDFDHENDLEVAEVRDLMERESLT